MPLRRSQPASAPRTPSKSPHRPLLMRRAQLGGDVAAQMRQGFDAHGVVDSCFDAGVAVGHPPHHLNRHRPPPTMWHGSPDTAHRRP
jgi:hypothetical protein